MDINLDLLKIQNPWWEDADINKDPSILDYNKKTLKWKPEVISELLEVRNKEYAIYGARGVGKTTILKLYIKKLLEIKQVKKENIFYYSCENLNTYEQLNEIVKQYLSWRKKETKDTLYLVIDEPSILIDWRKGIKYLKTSGLFKGVTIVIAGSVYSGDDDDIFINKKIIHSLSFREFIQLTKSDILEKMDGRIETYDKYKNRLEHYLDAYFLTGGFISAINDYYEKGEVSQSIYYNYFYWLLADFARMDKDIIAFRQIIEKIIIFMGKIAHYNAFASNTKVKTHVTVANYIDMFEHMYSVRTICQRDKDGKVSKGMAKRIYFSDPLLFWTFYSHLYGALSYWNFSMKSLRDGKILKELKELVVCSDIIKEISIQNDDELTFWKNTKGRVINFIIKKEKNIIPIIYDQEYLGIEQYKTLFKSAGYHNGIIISDAGFDVSGNYKIVPLMYFLIHLKDLCAYGNKK